MRKYIFFILVIAIAVLFLVPESMMGEYKGLLKTKYFLRDTAFSVRSIVSSLARGEIPEEFKTWEEKVKEKLEEGKENVKEEVKDTLKESAKDVIDGL